MAPTAAELAQLRRMVNEPNGTPYDDATLITYIERNALVDENGEPPRVPSSTNPGLLEANTDWTATYDLNATAAEIWEEKAAVLSQDFDMDVDGGEYSRSQAFTQAQQLAQRYRSRRSIKTVTQIPDKARERTLETTSGV